MIFNGYFKMILRKKKQNPKNKDYEDYVSVASCTLLVLLNFINMSFRARQIPWRYIFMDFSAVFSLLV